MSTKLGTLTLDLIAKIGSFTEPMKKAGDTAQRETKRIESSVSSASKAIAGLGAAALAGLTVGSVINMADEYTQMAARIRNATADTAEYDMVQKRLLETANGTYRSLSEAQEVYLSLAGGMKSLGKTTEQTLNVADSLSYAFVANAARADQAQSAMDALNKSMAKGKIDADAWISIVSAADNIIADMAKVTGKTEAEIRQLGATGKIALSDLLTTLEVTKDANQALADNMENSLADGLQKVRNSFSAFVGEINVTYGVTSKMAGALSILADNLNVVATAGAVVAVAMGSRMVVEFGKTNAAMLANTIATRNKVLADYERAKAELAATAAMVQSMGPMNAQTAAMMSNAAAAYQKAAAAKAATLSMGALATAGRGALALFGGPIGLGLTVATVAASYLLMRDNADKSTESLRANNQTVADAITKYRELNSIQRDAQMVAERQKLDELNEAYRKASAELMVYASNMGSMGEVVTESQAELSKLFAEYKKTGDLDKFNTSVQNSSKVSQDAKDKTANFAKAVFEAGSASKTQKEFIAQLSGELNSTANAGNNAAAGVRNLASALSEVNTKLSSDVFSAKLQNAFEKQGKSSQSAARWTQIYNENAKNGFKGVTVAQKKMLDELDAVDKQREARQKAAQAAANTSAKASKSALSQQVKDAKEAERLREQQAHARERIAYEFATREMQIEKDLAAKIEEIRKAKFSAGDTSGFIQNAMQRASLEKQLYIEILAADLNEWQETATEKLDRQVKINSLRIQLDSQMNDELKDQALKSLADKSNAEIEKIRIAQSKQLLEAKRTWMTAGDYAKEYYALVREEILNTAEYSPEIKQSLVKEANFNQGLESNSEREQVWGDYKSMMGLEKSPYQEDMDLLAEARAQMLITEEEYQQQRLGMQMAYGAQYGADFAGMMMGLVDSSSSAYAILGGVQKGFALFSTAMNSYQAISAAWASAPFPYNLPAVGIATMETGLLQAAVSALSPVGMAHNGIDSIPREGTWLLDGGERVLNPQQNKDLTNYLSQAQNSGGQSQVNLNPNFVIVDERESLGDYLFSPDGTKAFVKFFKRNRSALGV